MPLSLDQFTQQLVALGLLSADEVSEALAQANPEHASQDAEPLARSLIKQKKITAFQAQQIYLGKGESLVWGNYVILNKLGQGGMGMVLKAEHRRMKRIVALKMLAPTFAKNPEMTRRFQREVEVTARLEHPHIVTAHDADEANGTPFLVMQYIEGTNLSTLVKRQGPLSVEKALRYLLQAARGLEYAHQHGVVHRDIKPANLLLDGQGTLKILDLGMARLDSADNEQERLTDIGQIMGTVDFMAPEQAMDTRIADARADIYSLGITLWYLLTGRPVYEGNTIVQKLMAHRKEPIPSLGRACLQASPELEALFEKMVAKTRKARYQTMTEVIVELERLSEPGISDPSAAALEEDSRFSEFLRRIESSSSPTVMAQPARPAGESSVIVSFSQVKVEPPSQDFLIQPSDGTTKTSRPRARRGRALNFWIFGGTLAAVLMLAGIVSLASTKDAAIRMEIHDPQTTVAIKGTEIVLSQADRGQEVRLAAGERTLIVQREDFRFETSRLMLKPGEIITVRVELLADQVEVRRGEKLIGRGKLPEAPVAARRSEWWNEGSATEQTQGDPRFWEKSEIHRAAPTRLPDNPAHYAARILLTIPQFACRVALPMPITTRITPPAGGQVAKNVL